MTCRLFLTKEDREILLFVELYGSISITQCQNMFYNRQGRGYEMSRVHLAKLVKYSKLSVFKEKFTNKNVYYMTKQPSYHGILVLDYLSNLIKNGATINYFKQEQPWMGKKYKSDAYCMYTLGDRVLFDIVEVVRTKSVEIDKYIAIFDSGEAHALNSNLYRQLSGKGITIFPRLIIIDDVQHKNEVFVNEEVKVIQLDFQLNNFTRVFL
jgi:hypothetical protein